MIAIIDYDAGNIRSVEKALQYLGATVCISRDPDVIGAADKVVLPGVGAFGSAMEHIRGYGLEKVIYSSIDHGTPFLGICLGLQVLFEDSEESPDVPGLALLRGHIRKFRPEAGIKIPHMGWNSLKLQNNGRLFQNIQDDPYVYFVHSYYLKADDPGIVTACTKYGSTIADVSIQYGNLFGCQFHPEKSSRTGLAILENFIEL